VTGEVNTGTCPDPNDYWWVWGRRLMRQVFRIVVNHDRTSPMYGDAWMGGNHGTFAALFANAQARGWTDRAAGWDPGTWSDAQDVWEHLHPSIVSSLGYVLIGEGWALSIDPRDGRPWGSNGIRTAYVDGYEESLVGPNWYAMGPVPYLDLWPDSGDEWSGPTNDWVRSMSHCPDGTLWIGSLTHGLARIDPSGAISFVTLPAPAKDGEGASAVACDPADSSLWIGLAWGGVMRMRGSDFEAVDATGAPAFARHPVASIQIDAWSHPRVVYFAFDPTLDASGNIVSGGGVGAYDGK